MSSHSALITDAENAAQIYLVKSSEWPDVPEIPNNLRAQAKASGFKADAGQVVWTARDDGAVDGVLCGVGAASDSLALAHAAAKLKAGHYQVQRAAGYSETDLAMGWVDGAYRFQRYLETSKTPPKLVVGAQADALVRQAVAIDRLRDMVNTPAEDMGPADIQGIISALAETYAGTLKTIQGEALLTENFPMVHAVGRAGPQPPRIMALEWGDPTHPELAIVGKGVAFDTGGLNLKTGNYMRLMKKDMGGAAHAIALAELVMGANLPVHLKLYIPAVENAISGTAFRPGDVLRSRKGLSVEIDNTDAEGRLILADALAWACETKPDLIIDFATLTGAARVALGPDLAPYYTADDGLAADMKSAAAQSGDPAWQMPLWQPYKAMLKSPIADLVNSASSSFAGSVTAALFLQHFVDTTSWIHLDVWAWRERKYGRPAGGAACGLRAAWTLLQSRYS